VVILLQLYAFTLSPLRYAELIIIPRFLTGYRVKFYTAAAGYFVTFINSAIGPVDTDAAD